VRDSSEDDADGSESDEDDALDDWKAYGSSRPHLTSVPEPQVLPTGSASSFQVSGSSAVCQSELEGFLVPRRMSEAEVA
jgi:hypothetical protein